MTSDTSSSSLEMDERLAAKFPPCSGLALSELRRALKVSRREEDIDVPALMNHRRCTAREADALLRAAAGAGYVAWVPEADAFAKPPFWQLSDLGLRLLADDLGTSIDLKEAERILAALLERVHAHNQSSPLLLVTHVRHFGSTLLERERQWFGDVDVDLTIARAPGVSLAAFANEHNVIQQVVREYRAQKAIRRDLRKGLPKLALTLDEVERRGFAHRIIYRFDPDQMKEGQPDDAITPAREQDAGSARQPLPPLTAIAPLVPDRGRDTRFALPDRRGLKFEAIAAEEVRAWAGTWHGDCLRPLDLRRGLAGKVLGARDLLPAWRDPTATGRDLLAAAFTWASDRELRLFRWEPIRVHVAPRTRYASYGPLSVDRVAERIEARLCAKRAGTTRGEIAVQYTLALALGLLVDAVGHHHGARIELLLWPEAFIEAGSGKRLAMSRDARAFVRLVQTRMPLGEGARWRDVRIDVGHETRVSVNLGGHPAEPALHDVMAAWASAFAKKVIEDKAYLLRVTFEMTD